MFKNYKFEITSKDAFIWLIIMLVFGLTFFHLREFDWDVLITWLSLGLIPVFFMSLFGRRV